MTAFGPQSANYTTTRPASDADVSGGVDTWFQDCSGVGAMDGTIPTASWFNVVTANLRTAVTNAGVTLNVADDTMIWQAMQAAAATSLATLTASRGLERDTNDFQLTVGQGVDTVLTDATIDALNDLLVIYDASGTAIAEGTIYNMVKSVLSGLNGITFNDGAGTITGALSTHTIAATAPAGAVINDTWWSTATDELFRYTNDGANNLWIQIA